MIRCGYESDESFCHLLDAERLLPLCEDVSTISKAGKLHTFDGDPYEEDCSCGRDRCIDCQVALAAAERRQ